MKHNIIILSVAAAFLFLTSACKHNNSTEATETTTIVYSVQNADIYAGHMSDPVAVAVEGDEELDNLLDQFCDRVAAGYTVTFYNPSAGDLQQTKSTKSKDSNNGQQSISTTSRDELKAWCSKMEKAGRTVVISYDDKTGIWNGYAYAIGPSSSSQMSTFVANYSAKDFVTLLTADPANGKLYITSQNNGLWLPIVNQGIVVYNAFNAADSGFAEDNAATMLFVRNLLDNNYSYPSHYKIPDCQNFNFDVPSFSMLYMDKQNGYQNVADELHFSQTSQYETWVCDENEMNIVMHVDRSTIDTTSYTFSGLFAVQTNSDMVPIINGDISIHGGELSGVEGDGESCVIFVSDGSDYSFGVERITDDYVIWNIMDTQLRFVRIK